MAKQKTMYCVVDIETTGGNYKSEKITEVAIYKFDGENILDEFVSLIDPECNIPYFITNLTGITNEMVKDSPKFYEVAKRIVEITDGCTFVAHNVNFDYNFIKNEFKNLGYDFSRKKACTVKLSRKLIPGQPSYSLGKLCSSLGISIKARHRAAGDAFATVQLFKRLLDIDKEQEYIKEIKSISLSGIHPDFDPESIKMLPNLPGVYHFYNEKDDLIYVGKSIHIRKRIISHFGNEKTNRAMQMKSEITRIEYEETGNELIALLQESHEIKKYKPLYNRAQRRSIFGIGLYDYYDQNGYHRLYIDKNKAGNEAIASFTSMEEAKNVLYNLVNQYTLCQKLTGLYQSDSACFHYGIGECKGACIQQEAAEDYNSRVDELIKTYHYSEDSFLIIDAGRTESENSAVYIHQGQYIGFGFFEVEETQNNIELIIDSISKRDDNREVKQIIKHYLNNSNSYKIISLSASVLDF